ncbi:MAG TPA: DUF177 domain-containing protein [candidate division Zixibacteria bacterium]|nr:DUF177 domain-containing protein [candidate division Zixibacteria bacterium]
MILDLREFETFPAHTVLKSTPDDIRLEYESLVGTKGIECRLDIQSAGEEFFCQGEVTAKAVVTCARCLTDFEADLTNSADFIVCTQETYDNRKDAIDDEDYVLLKGTDLRADISDIVRQTIILALSMKPLCSESCKGLCPQCGANLNERTCGCKIEHMDARWDDLKRLSGRG